MKDLKKKLNAFMQVCYHLMVGNQPKTQEESYICICDTLVMFRCAPPIIVRMAFNFYLEILIVCDGHVFKRYPFLIYFLANIWQMLHLQ